MAHIRPEKYIWLDGKLVPWDESHVHFLTHSLHYGLAAFEGIRSYEQTNQTGLGAVFRLGEHIDRLFNSCKLCFIDVPFSRQQVVEACKETLRANGLRAAYLRPLIFLGDGSMGLGAMDPPVRVGISTYVWGRYLGDEGFSQGIRAKISSYTRNNMQVGLPKGKICGQYVNSVLAKREVLKGGYDEAILLDSSGMVAEATGENIFAVIRGKLVTPPLSSAILEGITRDTVLQLATALGIPTVESPIARDQLLLADEVFLTGTAAEVTPVREIDDRIIGEGRPGPITQQLQKTFLAVTSGQFPGYTHWLSPFSALSQSH